MTNESRRKRYYMLQKGWQKMKSFLPTTSIYDFYNTERRPTQQNESYNDDRYANETQLDKYLRKFGYVGLGAIFVLMAFMG